MELLNLRRGDTRWLLKMRKDGFVFLFSKRNELSIWRLSFNLLKWTWTRVISYYIGLTIVSFSEIRRKPMILDIYLNGVANFIALGANFYVTSIIWSFVVEIMGTFLIVGFGEVGHDGGVIIGWNKGLSFLLNK